MAPVAKMEPKKPTPGSASVYNHILQYTTQKRESQHPYTTFTPSHCAPTEPSRNIPPRPKANSPGRCRNTAHSIITRPRTFPLASPCRGQPGHGGPDSSNNRPFGQGRLNTPDRPTQPAASVRIHPTTETRP